MRPNKSRWDFFNLKTCIVAGGKNYLKTVKKTTMMKIIMWKIWKKKLNRMFSEFEEFLNLN